MQYLKIRHKRLLEDLQILNTSPRHKTKRAQEMKIEDSRNELSAGAHVAHRTVCTESFAIGSRVAEVLDRFNGTLDHGPMVGNG
jgi:hypothetical protein